MKTNSGGLLISIYYDGHAAYLASKHGATPAKLKAATDYGVVKEAISIAEKSSWDTSNNHFSETDDLEDGLQ